MIYKQIRICPKSELQIDSLHPGEEARLSVNQQEKKRTCNQVDFATLVANGRSIKENEKIK